MGLLPFRETDLCPPCSFGEAVPSGKTSLWLLLSSCFHFLLSPPPSVLKMGASASHLTTAWSARVGSLPLSSGPAFFFCFVFLFSLLSAQSATALPRTQRQASMEMSGPSRPLFWPQRLLLLLFFPLSFFFQFCWSKTEHGNLWAASHKGQWPGQM